MLTRLVDVYYNFLKINSKHSSDDQTPYQGVQAKKQKKLTKKIGKQKIVNITNFMKTKIAFGRVRTRDQCTKINMPHHCAMQVNSIVLGCDLF